MCNADKLIVMPEHATLAPPICRLAGEVLSIGRRVTQKGVVYALRLFVYRLRLRSAPLYEWVEICYVGSL